MSEIAGNKWEKFDAFTDRMKYEEATDEMNEKGRYKLANYMAHGYSIESTANIVMIRRGDDELLLIDNEGNIWKAQKAI